MTNNRHVLMTRSAVDRWRRAAGYPKGRIGVFFGTRTTIGFGDQVSPLDFDFYPTPDLEDGILLLDRGLSAYKLFRELDPDWEIIF